VEAKKTLIQHKELENKVKVIAQKMLAKTIRTHR